MTDRTPPVLSATNLRKTFSTDEVETTAVADVTLDVMPGEFVAVMGPSGCGKSTLLSLLGLLDEPTGGRLEFLGTDVSNASEAERARLRRGSLGFVFQSFNLIDELTVEENVALPLEYLDASADEREARVDAALERVGLSHRRGHFPRQLSGGQQQRAAVARAVVAGPSLLLADEPTGNLDSNNGDEVMHLLSELNDAGTSVVMVTHSPADAEYADRVINLFDGQVLSEGLLNTEVHTPSLNEAMA